MSLPILLSGVLALGLGPGAAPEQTLTATDTLHLAALQARAVANDARTARRTLEQQASALRGDNLGVARLPQFQIRGDAAYQSEVIALDVDAPGFSSPVPPKDRYELALDADWTLWDGGLTGSRQRVEAAGLAGTLAGIDADIFGTRIAVTDAFFSALLLQEQIREVEVLMGDLDIRLGEMLARLDEGLALPGEVASLRAELLGATQRRDALRNERRIALGTLSRLVGTPLSTDAGGTGIGSTDVLALPDLSSEVAARRFEPGAADTLTVLPPGMRTHPRFAAFDAQRMRADLQAEAVDATASPSVSVFGQFAFGSPGYDQFNDSLHEYWRGGVRFQWAPWNWDRRTRDVEEIRVQQRLIDTQEDHFADEVLRALERPLRTMEYMRTALESDDEIIALREEAEALARARFEERAISVSAYTDVRADLQEARIARLRHRTELVRAQALYLLTLGVELR